MSDLSMNNSKIRSNYRVTYNKEKHSTNNRLRKGCKNSTKFTENPKNNHPKSSKLYNSATGDLNYRENISLWEIIFLHVLEKTTLPI